MTPQLQESIKILQLGSLELIPYIATELEQNPFLERDEGQALFDEDPEDNTQKQDENKPETIDKPPNNWEDDEISPAIYEADRLIYNNTGRGNNITDSGEDALENVAARTITLQEHVTNQINSDIKDPNLRLISLYITQHLDENGYISVDMDNLAQILKCDKPQIESAIKTLQQFDPPGVFARNLSECLALQLKDRNRLDPAMETLVNNLDLMAKCDFKTLKKICGVDEQDLKEMLQEIKALNPRPGNNFSFENLQILQVDVFLKQDNKGNWQLELNNAALPRVLVNRRYYAKIEHQILDKTSRKFLTQRWNTANWLAKALDQRANTILKIARQIVIEQDDLFRRGIHYLKPLVIADIASAVSAHESTVSRVINGKYIATHMGTYELKYFFSSSVASLDDGEDISSKRIKYMIKQLIDAESPKSILSDDKIAALLQKQDIDIARRTVMKYREAMNIPSSISRRRQKEIYTHSASSC